MVMEESYAGASVDLSEEAGEVESVTLDHEMPSDGK
jgi:hypothetical protein